MSNKLRAVWASCLVWLLLSILDCPCLVIWVTNLSNKTLIFHDFQGLTIKFHNFTGLENGILQLHCFPGFPWSVRSLFIKTTITKIKKKNNNNQRLPLQARHGNDNWTNLRCKRQNGVSHIVKHTCTQYSYVIVRPKKNISHTRLVLLMPETIDCIFKSETKRNPVVKLQTKVSMVLCS